MHWINQIVKRLILRLSVCAILLLLSTATASAQPKITLTAPKPGRIDCLVPVMAQSARCVALSDVHGLLAFGHDRDYAAAHVTLVRLDGKGAPLAYAIPILLPKPAGLLKNKNYVTGVAFHPKLPLLYVWQDVDVPYSNPVPPGPPEVKQFDHLCIFNFAKETPELLVSLCRGEEFMHGQFGGAIAVDATGTSLYVPNLREIKNAGSLRFGRFPLTGDGLPYLSENDAKEPMPASIKKLTELSVAAKLSPPHLTPIEYVNIFHLSTFGCGQSFVPIGKDAVISSVNSGLLTWRADDKHATLHALPLKNTGFTQFVVHPTLPAIFATVNHGMYDSFFRAEHSEGYLTLLPRQYVIPGSKLSGPPAFLSKQGKAAVGGQYVIYLLSLDARAFPNGDVIQIPVNCPQVSALVYSERFDRLYVGVELSK